MIIGISDSLLDPATSVTSVVSDSVWPNRQQPTRLPCPWDSPGKNTGVGCHFLLQCMKVKTLSRARLLVTPWTTVHQAPPSMGFSRQEYWSRMTLPFPDTIFMVTRWLPQIQFHLFTQQYPMTRKEFSFSVPLKKEEIFSRGHHAQIF